MTDGQAGAEFANMDIDTDIAIAHKDHDVLGGGEVLCHRLAKFLDCPLYVGRRNQEHEPSDADLDIHEIPLSRLEKQMIDRGGLPRTLAYMLRWPAAADELTAYDTLITSGNEPLWYVPEDDQAVVAYTHSTPRYMYDLFNEHMDFAGLSGRLATAFYAVQRTLYESNTHRPDGWVANSDLVARRIERYWNIPRDRIRIVYPPVDTHRYSPDDATTGNAYLYLGRLDRAKRVDELIKAFNYLDGSALLIAGDGPDRDRLQRLAGDNVTFLGFVDEDRKRELYSQAKALLYPPVNEDFGMVPIEAMAAGTPVIGVRDGFTRFQVLDGDNGLLFDRGVRNLHRAIRRFEDNGVAWSPEQISAFADQFGVEQFRDGMIKAINEAQRRATITPKWRQEADPDVPTPGQPSPVVTDGGGA